MALNWTALERDMAGDYTPEQLACYTAIGRLVHNYGTVQRAVQAVAVGHMKLTDVEFMELPEEFRSRVTWTQNHAVLAYIAQQYDHNVEYLATEWARQERAAAQTNGTPLPPALAEKR